MTPSQWQDVKRLFHEALDHPVDGRAAWLAQQGRGDPEVRAEVERLITAHLSAGSFIEIPVIDLHAEQQTAMALAAGTRLGPYEIVAPIGAGGMGEVYRGRDPRLDRTVAIKVLPGHLSSDPNRRARLEREAKSIAGLTHPHICTLHDVGEHAGAMFLVMEHLEGQTLAHRLEQGPVAIEQALTIATEVADALSEAHRQGLIHRDLKPANVMLARTGTKLLDFGLAKLTRRGEQGALPPLMSPPARSAVANGEGVIVGILPFMAPGPETEAGVMVGTVAYMSPEQAEGKNVDARSDIFAFGVLLYEMVTGRRAFEGDTRVSTLAAILHKEPPPLEDAPPELERIIALCLRKDPDCRIQHMVDVRLALEELKDESNSGTLVAAAPRRRPSVLPWAIAATAVVVLAAASIAFWVLRPPAPLEPPVLMQLTADAGLSIDPALSPDGKMLAYASDRAGNGNLHIWVRQIGGGEARRLTDDAANEREPAFSPDGTMVAFRSEKDGGGIHVVSALGGKTPPRQIAPDGQRPRFSPDASQIAYWTGDFREVSAAFSGRNLCRIFVAPTTGGAPSQVRADFLAAAYPEWAPDGRHLLFLGRHDDTLPVEESIDWWVTPLDQGPAIATGALKATRQAQLTGHSFVYPWALIPSAWDRRGDWLVFSARSGDSRNLWRIGVSSRTWKATGLPERLTSSSAIDQSPSVASIAAGTVTIAFASQGEKEDIWSLPIEANTGTVTGAPRQLSRDSARNFHTQLSRDGGKVVFISTRSGHQEIWIKDLATGQDMALTDSRVDKFEPSFSPDGRSVAFSANEGGKYNHYLIPAAGGAAERIGEDGGRASSWSPRGQYVIGNSVDGRLILIDVAARRMIDLLAIEGRWFLGKGFSPDGRSIWFWELRGIGGTDGGAQSANGGYVPSRTYTAPFQGETMAPESAWSTRPEIGELSPDEMLSYKLSNRDGFTCVWAQPVDRVTRRPAGDPRPIYHSHVGVRLGLRGMSIGRERMIFDLAELTGNIWTAEWKRGW